MELAQSYDLTDSQPTWVVSITYSRIETLKIDYPNLNARRNLYRPRGFTSNYIWFFSLSLAISSVYLVNNQVVIGASDSFDAHGTISSLIFAMPPSASVVNMTSVQKFILSGSWNLSTEEGKLLNFSSDFYTGPANGADNHTHQLRDLRVVSEAPIVITPEGSTKILGILNIGTNGKAAWKDVDTEIMISNGRTIRIGLADEDSQRHFMGQPIYGIVENIRTR
jgi:hypothetical protein